MRGRYLTPRRMSEIERSLSDRDRAVLATLVRVRLATGDQLARLHGTGVSRRQARQVLASLTERRLLARLPRLVGGVRAGSAGYVYGLDIAGHHLTRAGGVRPHRPWQPGPAFLAHTLAVTELYVRLRAAERDGLVRLSEFVTEPACWQAFPGPGGGRVVLKPDAQLVLQLGGYEDRWFVEVDRATEATTRLTRACDRYRAYWASGLEQACHGVFPRVLWLVPDERRHAQLVDVLGHQPAEAWPLFTAALYDDAVPRLLEGAGS
ncbi:MAG: replication-relaxation family protein [Frankiaceae bacterium]